MNSILSYHSLIPSLLLMCLYSKVFCKNETVKFAVFAFVPFPQKRNTLCMLDVNWVQKHFQGHRQNRSFLKDEQSLK